MNDNEPSNIIKDNSFWANIFRLTWVVALVFSLIGVIKFTVYAYGTAFPTEGAFNLPAALIIVLGTLILHAIVALLVTAVWAFYKRGYSNIRSCGPLLRNPTGMTLPLIWSLTLSTAFVALCLAIAWVISFNKGDPGWKKLFWMLLVINIIAFVVGFIVSILTEKIMRDQAKAEKERAAKQDEKERDINRLSRALIKETTGHRVCSLIQEFFQFNTIPHWMVAPLTKDIFTVWNIWGPDGKRDGMVMIELNNLARHIGIGPIPFPKSQSKPEQPQAPDTKANSNPEAEEGGLSDPGRPKDLQLGSELIGELRWDSPPPAESPTAPADAPPANPNQPRNGGERPSPASSTP